MRLHRVRRGRGEPLLLIQGLSGNHLHWGEPFMTLLERSFDVVAYDHRGVGRSPRDEESFSIADLAEDAAGVLDDAELESVHVLGISMGGMVAQELALRHAGRVRTLTLGCTYAGGPEGTLAAPSVVAPLFDALRAGDRERAIRASWEVNVSPEFASDEEHFAAFRTIALELPTAVAAVMRQIQAIGAHDTSERLGDVTAPTLVVHGTADLMLPVSNGEAIARAIPGARLERLEGVGHMFWLERPERTAELLRAHALAGAAAS
jgi:pimeloyl-ACP methyl ester carboxylesterase